MKPKIKNFKTLICARVHITHPLRTLAVILLLYIFNRFCVKGILHIYMANQITLSFTLAEAWKI